MHGICQHYEDCGGCSLQHLSEGAYYRGKQSVVDALAADLFAELVLPLLKVGRGQRRRVNLKLSVYKKRVLLGFYARGSHEVVGIEQCLVADPAIMRVILDLRQVFEQMKKPSVIEGVAITALDCGVEVVIRVRSKLRATDVEMLQALDLARLVVVRDDVLLREGDFYIMLAGYRVDLPVGSFLQASGAAQDEMTKQVMRYAEGCSRIADMFCGVGSFALPLSDIARVSAFEVGGDMVAALQNAGSTVQATVRDLYRDPVIDFPYDMVVINPPRAGALTQVHALAGSGVGRVAMVSCNPKTFARDAKVLLGAGYKMKEIRGIDQFLWSEHLEIVALFTKG